jgi:ABC-type multidrug transport system fused ATPase/permease subunit
MALKRNNDLVGSVLGEDGVGLGVGRGSPVLGNRDMDALLNGLEIKHAVTDLIAGPTGHGTVLSAAEAAEAARIRRINLQLLRVSVRLAQDDATIGRVRFVMIAIMSLGTLVVGAAFVFIAASTPGNIAALSVTGGITALALASVFFVNPLQTVERDMVFRRWSDAIMSSFIDQIAADSTGFKEIGEAQGIATRSFALLAASYASTAGKADDTLLAAISALTASASADATKDAEPTTITVVNPGPQKSTAGSAIEPLQISATGPGTLAFESTTLPVGILPISAKGVISGKPAEESTSTVTVTVTSDSGDGSSSAVSFEWVVGPVSMDTSTQNASVKS